MERHVSFARGEVNHEEQKALELIESTRKALASGSVKKKAQIEAWAALCQSLMASNEFRYID